MLVYDAQIAAVKTVTAKSPCVIVEREADDLLYDEYDVCLSGSTIAG